MIQEFWKDLLIENHGIIKISNLGKVISASNNTLTPLINSKGYLEYRFDIYVNKKRKFKSMKLHRLLCLAFIPNPNNYPIINHIDGNKLNNNLGNLEWCTVKHNNNHAWKIHLHKEDECRGENNPSAKLTEEQVLRIRYLFSQGLRISEIVKEYNVSWSSISLIVKRKSWTHI